MKYLRSIFQIVVLCFVFGTTIAQQVPMYSQYIMNGFLVNPSFVGRDGYTTVNLTVREQWVGMTGSPSTYAASFQTSLQNSGNNFRSRPLKRRRVSRPSRNRLVGAGGYIFNDNNGIIKRTGLQGDYAYHITMGKAKRGQADDLSFGLALTLYQYFVNEKGLVYSYDDDPYFNNYDKSVFIPDVNFGTSYTTNDYYVGFSMTNMLRGSILFANTTDNKRGELGHYFLTGGYNYKINKEWTLKPSCFIKSSDMFFKSIQLDLTARLFYMEDYWGGLSWRTNDAIIIMGGVKYNKFYFAYAFDLALTDIRKQSYGTHELTLAVKFGESSRRYRWLNSF